MGRKPNTAGIKINPDDIEFESMIFYITWYEQLKECGDDFFLKAVKELCEYSFHGVIPDNSNDPLMNMFFKMAKGSIDANIKLRIAGKMGSEARWGKKEETEEKPKERRKRTPKKKEPEPIPDTSEDDEEGWIEPTPENIARSIEEYEREHGTDGTS